MTIESIDNVSEDDGLALVVGRLAKITISGSDQRLVAIVPEYRPDGRLDRLDVVTMAAGDLNVGISDALEGLRCFAGAVAEEERSKRLSQSASTE